MSSPARPEPSATVVILRDGLTGLEVLLLQRSARGEGGGGAWVFPGGRVEPGDHDAADPDPALALQRSAVRETREEAGLELAPASLISISRWITPELSPRRFDTWFYATHLSKARESNARESQARGGVDAEVRVDGQEICGHRWIRPAEALDASRRGEIRLAPPTFVTTDWLVPHATAGEALRALARAPFVTFRPRICRIPDGACMLYPGDAGYDEHDPERAGPRHRLWALADGMKYERSL